MNAQESATVLAYMAAAYPHANVSEQTALVWAEHLIGVTPDVGLEAARTITKSARWFPSIAEFMEQVRAIDRAHEPAALPAAPNSLASREQAAEFIRLARETLAAQRGNARNHYHGTAGPKGAWKDDECPVCAQIPPPYGQVEAGEAF